MHKKTKVIECLAGFSSFSLHNLEALITHNRMEEKFLLHIGCLNGFLDHVKSDYNCLEINEHRYFDYKSTYLDTSGYQMFLDHHNNKFNRYKIRFRAYALTGETFLEIKHKTNKMNMLKYRQKMKSSTFPIAVEASDFISCNSPYEPTQLELKVSIHFQRITLLHKKNPSKVTVDFGIFVHDERNNIRLNNLAVVEHKWYGKTISHEINTLFSHITGGPARFSKYCIGLVLLNPNLKYNNFKPLLQKIDQITKPTSHVVN